MLTKDEIRQRIDALECLTGVHQAVEDVEGVDWEEDDTRTFALNITAGPPVSFVHNVPPAVLVAGLRAMARELGQMADLKEAAT